MALKDIVFRRLEVFINEFKKNDKEIQIKWDSKLGMPPIGFDDRVLQNNFWDGLNGNPIGFRDLLTKPIDKSELTQSTKVSELVDAILGKSSVDTRELYEAKVSERVRLALREQIAKLARIDDATKIIPTKKVSDYLPDRPVGPLLDALNGELKKYLIGGLIQDSSLNGTLAAAQDSIVLRMLA